MKRSILSAFLLSIVTACGGGGGGSSDSALCDSITGGGATVTSSGPVSNSNAAADGDLGTYAALNLSVTSQTASVRATAQDGIVYPAGSKAGAFVLYANQGSANVTTIRTYLNGAPVEASTPGTSIFEPAGPGFYSGFTATAPFNAVEFNETDNGTSGSPDYRVYEICSDAHF